MSLLAPNPPHGFESFWRETSEEALALPLDFELQHVMGADAATHKAQDTRHHQAHTYTFRGSDGTPRHGWLAFPEKGGPYPAFLWIPPYGRESLLPNAYGTREGFVSGSLNFFGYRAFYEEKYRPERGYLCEGILDPKTWVMRSMFQDAVLAARILREQPEVDREKLGVMGMSQGGGFAIWLGAWIGWIRAICADMPFLGGVSQTLGDHVYRYPLKELLDFAASSGSGLDQIRETIRWFDTLNQATFCRKPTQLSLGEKDPAVRPVSVEAIFEALPGEKELRRYPGGHDWWPEMIDNNRSWLLQHVH